MSDSRPSQEEKHKLGRASSKFKDTPRVMQSDDYFARKFKAINGSMGPATSLNASNSESGAPANGTPAMPKMGVRARVSEWPPKKDCSKELACKVLWGNQSQTSYDSVTSIMHNGQNDQSDGQPKEQLDLDFVEAKYTIGDIFVHSPQRGLHPIRQRSNSDVTISDIDAEDVLDQNAVNPNTGAALHREYGSTSSIDRQGLSGENFFAMLRGYRVDSYDHKVMAPFGFPEFFSCDPAVSPSLHAAAQISRGEFVRISGLDYMDSALLMGRDRDKPFKRRLKSESVETSLFRKLRTVKSEHETFKFTSDLEDGRLERGIRPWNCQRCFAHYDVQSILFNINEAMATRANVGKRKNMTTGASAASQTQAPGGQAGSCESPLGSKEDLNSKENLDADEGDGKSNDLVLSCPYFRNETGGEGDRRIALSRANSASFSSGESCSFESSLSSHCTNAGVSVLEVPRENQPIHREKVKRYIIEHIDLGAYYYRKFFYGKEHQNYFGIDENLGPVAVSIRREKVEDAKEKEGSQFNYRVAFRTSELTTLRGAILEDAVPSTARHGTARGLPLKEVLEYVVPELSIQCLRQAASSPKVSEQLLKLDEQGLSFQHKVGVLYCKAGQSTEEEMYNNETAGPAFEEFLDLLGQRVRLKGFSKYRAQLDNKTDSTGTHSLYTTYKDYELMFHVSTMLPHMPNNRQQRLGIVTRGCETVEMTLRRNGLGQLGFHVNFEGIVADVEPFGFAWKAGLRQGSRLVEICKVAVATLTHEQMIDLLRTSVTVKVVIIQPQDNTLLCRGCSELCRIPMVEYKLDSEGTPCEYKTPFRRNTTWHRVPTPALQPLPRASPAPGTPDRLQGQQLLQQAQAAIPRSTSFDRKLPDGTRSSPSNQSSSSDPGPGGSGPWRPQVGYDGCQSPLLLEHQGPGPLECEGAREREDAMDGSRHPETKWHGPPSKVLSSYKERGLQKEGGCRDSPNKLSHIGDKSCSSHSSSNTLSSNTSSNSDDKHFGSGDLMDPELLGLTYLKGASTDSGIDTTPCMPPTGLGPVHLVGSRSMIHSRAEPWADSGDISGPDDEQAKVYAVHSYAPASASGAADGSMGDLSEISSHSSGSHHSGSPSAHCSKSTGSLDTSKVYIVSHSSGPPVPGSMSKPYHRQGAVSKYVIGWKKSEGSPPPEEPEVTECQGLYGEMELMSTAAQHQTVVGDAVSDTPHVLSKEDFVKLMLPDSPLAEEGRRKFSFYGNLSPRRSLYRTLSDESMCSHRRGSSFGSSRSSVLDQALPSDILFSSTPPHRSTLPPRTQPAPSLGSLRNEFWFSDGSLSDKSKCADPGLMPLPDTGTGLDWSHLVDAARAFEGLDSDEELGLLCHHTSYLDQRGAPFCTLTDVQHRQGLEGAQELPLCVDPGGKEFMDTAGEQSPSTLTGKVNQLELVLRQLQTDLRKEKQDKAALQAEVQHLRLDNRRLQEESQTAAAQLRTFTEWFLSAVDKKP
uniref:Signal induced proliferation associated 1 like 2 n=1 Tax=Molossus molossus TaxID=27622 RepID=A0A7J8BMD8_MOLMO|nr:signal induced proliferation associated 1 like 2 [Molossus molossus]